MGFKDRVEVDAGDAQRLQIIELMGDPLQIAAEIILVSDLAVGIGFPLRLFVPVGMEPAVLRDA